MKILKTIVNVIFGVLAFIGVIFGILGALVKPKKPLGSGFINEFIYNNHYYLFIWGLIGTILVCIPLYLLNKDDIDNLFDS